MIDEFSEEKRRIEDKYEREKNLLHEELRLNDIIKEQ